MAKTISDHRVCRQDRVRHLNLPFPLLAWVKAAAYARAWLGFSAKITVVITFPALIESQNHLNILIFAWSFSKPLVPDAVLFLNFFAKNFQKSLTVRASSHILNLLRRSITVR
jgi:hypothetical protein